MKQARRQASPRRQDDTDVTMDPAPGDDTGDTSSSDSVNYKRRDCKDPKEDRNRKEDDDHGDGKHSGKGRERHTVVKAHKPPKGKEKVKSATKKPQPKSPGTRSRTFGPATVFDSDDESDRRHVYDDTYRGACTTCKKYLKLCAKCGAPMCPCTLAKPCQFTDRRLKPTLSRVDYGHQPDPKWEGRCPDCRHQGPCCSNCGIITCSCSKLKPCNRKDMGNRPPMSNIPPEKRENWGGPVDPADTFKALASFKSKQTTGAVAKPPTRGLTAQGHAVNTPTAARPRPANPPAATPATTVLPKQATPTVTNLPKHADLTVTVVANQTDRTVTAKPKQAKTTVSAMPKKATPTATETTEPKAKDPAAPQARRSLRIKAREANSPKPETKTPSVTKSKPRRSTNRRSRKKRPAQTKNTARMRPGKNPPVFDCWGNKCRIDHPTIMVDLTPRSRRKGKTKTSLAAKAMKSKTRNGRVVETPTSQGPGSAPTSREKKDPEATVPKKPPPTVKATKPTANTSDKSRAPSTPSADTDATHGSQAPTVQELLELAFDTGKLSYLTKALVLDGLQKTNNHKEFEDLLKTDARLSEYNDAINRATRSTTVLDRGLTKQPAAIPGLMHVDCVRKSTESRGLKGAADHNACCKNEMGKSRCSVCLNIVCMHHSICDHRHPRRCPRTCSCLTCTTERSVNFVQLYRTPEKGTLPTFVAPPGPHWLFDGYEQHCEWAITHSTEMNIRVAFGPLNSWYLSAYAHQAVLVHDAKEAGNAQQLADALSMRWRFACGPSIRDLFCPHNEAAFIQNFLTWKATDADPVPRWHFTTWSFMHLADDFVMPQTFRELHLDPDKWLTPMLKFEPTTNNPNSSDEYEMFLRLRHMVNSNDRAHAMRCVDTLRVFVQHAILGSVRVTANRKANFTDRPIAPSVFESMEFMWPRVFGFLYQNRGEWTHHSDRGNSVLCLAPKESKHAHFRWSKNDIKTQTKSAVRLAICNARNKTIILFRDPFMRSTRPKSREVSNYLRRHNFGEQRRMPIPNFDKADYGTY